MAKKAMKLKQQKTPKFSTRAYTRCKLCGVFPAMPGDDLIAALWSGAGDERSQHTVLCNALYCPGHGFIVQHLEGVVGEGVQLVDGNLLHLFPLLLLSIFLGGKQVI